MLATIQSRNFCLIVFCLIHKDQNIQNYSYNFARGSVWVWNLISDIRGGTQTDGAGRVEVNILIKKG
jgi:hypothetical protein